MLAINPNILQLIPKTWILSESILLELNPATLWHGVQNGFVTPLIAMPMLSVIKLNCFDFHDKIEIVKRITPHARDEQK